MLRLFLAWATTTRNNDYIRMEGVKRLVGSSKHRKERVAGATLLIDWGTTQVTSGLRVMLTTIVSFDRHASLPSH